MKKSNIMLMGGLAGIVLILIALFVFLRINAEKLINFSHNFNSIGGSSSIERREIDYQDFDMLVFSRGPWEIEVQEGAYRIVLTGDRSRLEELKIDQFGRTVKFFADAYSRGGGVSENTVRVHIFMPDLKGLSLAGTLGDVHLKDFDLDSLVIDNGGVRDITADNAGVSDITADNMVIDQLRLIIYGVSNVQLSHIDIENCYLDVGGVSNISLNMTGGKLQ